MRISFITPSARGGYGGIAKYNENLLNYFIKKKDVKEIFLFSRSPINYREKKINNFTSKHFLKFFFNIFINTYKLLTSDIVFVTHINLIPFSILPIIFRKKVVMCCYGLEIWGQEKNFFYKFLLSNLKYFICMRIYTKKQLRKKYKVKGSKIYDLHNSIKFRKVNPKQSKFKSLVTVARLDKKEKYKGVDETLEAISKIKNKNFNYYVLGDGDDKGRLISKAKELKISDYVFFLGIVSNQKRDNILNNSHILAMPGSDKTFDTYPFRFIFLEAAEYGLHIIGSRSPDRNENLYQKKYSCLNLVDPKNRSNIIKKIRELLTKEKKISYKIKKDFSILNFEKELNKIVKGILIK